MYISLLHIDVGVCFILNIVLGTYYLVCHGECTVNPVWCVMVNALLTPCGVPWGRGQAGALQGAPHREAVRGGDRDERHGGGGDLQGLGRGHGHPRPQGGVRLQ